MVFRPIETGPFDVRIILTEEPKGGFTADLIQVDGGTAGTPVKGLTYKGASTTPAQTAELTFSDINYYNPGTTPAGNPTPVPAAADAGFPEATGRDNRYHEYSVTITPNPGNTDYVTISIKQFSDNVLPVGNMYVPHDSSAKKCYNPNWNRCHRCRRCQKCKAHERGRSWSR